MEELAAGSPDGTEGEEGEAVPGEGGSDAPICGPGRHPLAGSAAEGTGTDGLAPEEGAEGGGEGGEAV